MASSRRNAIQSGLTILGFGLAGCTGRDDEKQTTPDTELTTEATETTTNTIEATNRHEPDYTKSGPGPDREVSGRWPMFQYDAGRTGQSPVLSPPQSDVGRYWRLSPTGSASPFTSPPVVGEDSLYVGRNSTLEAFDPMTGTRRWSVRFDTSGEVRFSPAVAGDTVFACTYDMVFAIETTSGTIRWTQTTTVGGVSAPAVSDGTVFVSEGDPDEGGRLYAFDARDGTGQWTYEFDGDNRSAPAVRAESAYVVATDGTIHSVNVEGGTEQWQFEATGEGYTTPVASEGTVFFADRSGTAYRLDPEDGAVVWEATATVPRFHSGPALGQDTLYVGGREGVVALRRHDGANRWKHAVEEGATSPVVASETVYVGTATGEVLGLHAETGDRRWRFQVEEVRREDVIYHGVVDGLAVVNGGLFATSEGGDLYVLGEFES